MKKKFYIAIVSLLCVAVVGVIGFGIYKYKNSEKPKEPEKPNVIKPGEYGDTDFSVRLIKTTNSTQTSNYLISPYSIEIALNMLKDGAKENSYKQINDLIGTRKIPVFNAKNRISVTNGAFIKDIYKDSVKKEFYSKLNNYKAEIVYDKFTTPDKINNWVKEKTYGMIPEILKEMSPDFVLGLANAVAIDVKWDTQFECINTTKEEFTYENGSNANVEMMHNTFEYGDTKYFETNEGKGIVIPYDKYDSEGRNEYEDGNTVAKDYTQLEFVGILPNKGVTDYIEKITKEDLKSLGDNATTTKEADINVALPRFSYSFDLTNFREILMVMGVTDVFDPMVADLSNIIGNPGDIYVSTAIHKTYIDLNEKGTKAAAVTYFGMDKNAAIPQQRKQVSIKFNKPFVYMIRDSKTKEILFFGVVREPNVWKGSTCSNEQ